MVSTAALSSIGLGTNGCSFVNFSFVDSELYLFRKEDKQALITSVWATNSFENSQARWQYSFPGQDREHAAARQGEGHAVQRVRAEVRISCQPGEWLMWYLG